MSLSLEVQGRLHEIFNEVQVSDKFRKREFVLETVDGNYNQYPKFQLTQDKCSLLDGFNKGEEVKVLFNLSGRPFEKNGETLYFTNLSAWRIEKVGAAAQPAANNFAQPVAASNGSSFMTEEVDNDLPF
jgi:single-strand DNA-binding protein